MRGTLPRVVGGALLLAAASGLVAYSVEAQNIRNRSGVPMFQVDKSWPKLPANLKIGMLMGLAVDSHDHVWLFHRQDTLSPKDKEQKAEGKWQMTAKTTQHGLRLFCWTARRRPVRYAPRSPKASQRCKRRAVSCHTWLPSSSARTPLRRLTWP